MSNLFQSLHAKLANGILTVPTLGDLPASSVQGDIRYVNALNMLYTSDGTSWAVVAGGSGGTGTVTSIGVSGGTTGLTTSGGPVTTNGTITLAGTLTIANGGTGQTTAGAAFDALSPLTTKGDVLSYSTTNARLGVGSNTQVLTADSSTATGLKWATPTTGTVTSVAMSVPAFLSVSGSPVTSTGTLAITLSGTALPLTNGGTGQTTKSPAFNALSPMSQAGDIIYGGASGAGTALVAGSTTQVLHSGTTPSWSAISLTADVTGTLPVGNGGTGVVLSTGSGSNVLNTSPTLITPNLGTPSAATLTNATGLPIGAGTTGTLGADRGGTGVTNNAASTLTISGNFGTTFTVSGTTALTLPTSGTLATTAVASPTIAGLVTSYFPTIQSAVNNVSSANYTVTTSDGYLAIDVTTGGSDRTITLPSAAANAGRRLTVQKVDSGAGAVIVTSADNINGQTNYYATFQYQAVVLQCNGTTWLVAAGRIAGEILPNSAGSRNATVTSVANTWTAGTSLAVGAGTWLIQGQVNGNSASATGTYVSIYISGTSTTSGSSNTTTAVTGCTYGYDQCMSAMNASQGIGQAVVYGKVVTTTASSTTYFLGFGSDSSAANQFRVSMQAVRLA